METADLTVASTGTSGLLPITAEIAAVVASRGWHTGVLTVFVPHTTAGVTINEQADPDVARDMTWFFERLVPDSPHFRHCEGNSAAHIKASLLGSSVQVVVRNGTLQLGTWQGIYFAEFDGPRRRTVSLAFLGSGTKEV